MAFAQRPGEQPMSSEHVPPEVAVASPARAPNARARRLGCIAIVILLQLPWPGWLFPGESLSGGVLREVLFWLMAGLLLVYVLLGERRPLLSIGLRRPDWKSLDWGVGGAAITITVMAFIYLVIFPSLGLAAEEQQIREMKDLPVWFLVALVTRAAVFEELFYRGFAIERIAELTGRRWFAALASLGLFTLAHLSFWGWAHLIIVGYGGLVLTVIYLLRHDLASNMLAHW